MRAFSWLLLGAALGAVAAVLLAPEPVPVSKNIEEEWDIVDEASAESFTASD
jgi:gas vesicle protein